MEIVLNQLHKNQAKIYVEAKRFNVLCCGRRFGKTQLAYNLISEGALDGKTVAYFAPTYKLLLEVWRDIKEILYGTITFTNVQERRIEISTGGIVDFWSLDGEDAARGRAYHLVVIDEAAIIRNLEESWQNAIRPTLTDYKGSAWFLSTPKGKNYFYKLFHKAKSEDKGWQCWRMRTADNPTIDEQEIENARQDLPALAFSQEYLAEFNDNVANPFGFAFIQQCTYPLSTDKAMVYGIDLAKYTDWTVIIGLDKNGACCYFDRFQKDWKQTVQTILNLPPDAAFIIDSTGVGDPIGEDIARVRGNVELVKFTQNSKQQLMEGLAMAIQKRTITFPDGIIKDELENFEFEYTRSGVKYSAPEGLHDDCVCSLALAVSRLRKSAGYGNYDIV